MKKTLRKEYLSKRNALSQQEIKDKSYEINQKILLSEIYKKCSIIFTYINIGSEVLTTPIIEQGWVDGKKIAVPIAIKGTHEMYFVEISDFKSLKKTSMGVLEPEIDKKLSIIPNENTLFIVPGSVFDINKNRFGYGGGFYDSYFERYKVSHKVALAFDFQVLESIDAEEFDQKVDLIVTEKRIIV